MDFYLKSWYNIGSSVGKGSKNMDNYVKGNVDSYQGGKRQDYDDIDLNRHIANTLHMNLSQDLGDYIDNYLKGYHIPDDLKKATIDRVLVDLLNS